MARSSFRMYLFANLFLGVIVSFIDFPNGFGLGFIAMMFSSIITLPVIGMLWFYFWAMQNLRAHAVVFWFCLFVLIGLCALVALWLLGLLLHDNLLTDTWIAGVALLCAYLSVLPELNALDKFVCAYNNLTTTHENH